MGAVIGDVADGDPAFLARSKVDMVIANGAGAEEFEFWQLFNHFMRKRTLDETRNDLSILAHLDERFSGQRFPNNFRVGEMFSHECAIFPIDFQKYDACHGESISAFNACEQVSFSSQAHFALLNLKWAIL
jgi:hypothetical protein